MCGSFFLPRPNEPDVKRAHRRGRFHNLAGEEGRFIISEAFCAPSTIQIPMATTTLSPKAAPSVEADFLPLQGTDYIEFYVGNAKQAAHFYKTAFGFQSLAYSGPETGVRDRASYAIRQNKLTFVLTTPVRTENPIADHIYKHGDGVKVIALKVEDATSAWQETTKRGGKSFLEPKTLTDEHGKVVMSGIHTYGDTVHLFIERGDYSGPFMPGFRKWESIYNPARDWLAVLRSLRWQRRLEPDEPVGEILRGCDGLPQHP